MFPQGWGLNLPPMSHRSHVSPAQPGRGSVEGFLQSCSVKAGDYEKQKHPFPSRKKKKFLVNKEKYKEAIQKIP